MEKHFVESAIAILVEDWMAANATAWDTVGRGGPIFSLGDIGDWDYIDAQWAAHNAAVEADEAAAVEEFWAALMVAPVWLRMSRSRLEEAWNRAFISARHGYYVGHACMPDIVEVYARMGI